MIKIDSNFDLIKNNFTVNNFFADLSFEFGDQSYQNEDEEGICRLIKRLLLNTRAVQKLRSGIFGLFLSNTEINYQGKNVQEVCTTAL